MASDVVGNEVRRYLPVLAAKRGLDTARLRLAFAALPITWHGSDAYTAFEADARRLMASRDEEDWPTLALALALSLPVWSQDKDFPVGGVKVYGTGELLDMLQEIDLL